MLQGFRASFWLCFICSSCRRVCENIQVGEEALAKSKLIWWELRNGWRCASWPVRSQSSLSNLEDQVSAWEHSLGQWPRSGLPKHHTISYLLPESGSTMHFLSIHPFDKDLRKTCCVLGPRDPKALCPRSDQNLERHVLWWFQDWVLNFSSSECLDLSRFAFSVYKNLDKIFNFPLFQLRLS